MLLPRDVEEVTLRTIPFPRGTDPLVFQFEMHSRTRSDLVHEIDVFRYTVLNRMAVSCSPLLASESGVRVDILDLLASMSDEEKSSWRKRLSEAAARDTNAPESLGKHARTGSLEDLMISSLIP